MDAYANLRRSQETSSVSVTEFLMESTQTLSDTLVSIRSTRTGVDFDTMQLTGFSPPNWWLIRMPSLLTIRTCSRGSKREL